MCPKCGSAVRKLHSAPAIQFKGSGFYITDYGKDGKGPRKAEDKPAEKPAEKTGESGGAKESKKAEAPAKKAKPE